jgi:Flp pilus assembly protein TadD
MKEAEQLLKKALEVDPNCSEVYNSLGCVMLNSNKML